MIDSERPRRERYLSSDAVANSSPCARPERDALAGRFVRVERLEPTLHSDDLWAVVDDVTNDESWDYLPYGPWRERGPYVDWLESQARSTDPLFYAIRELATGNVVGIGSYLRIAPEAQSIEIGHLWFSPKLQRTPAATEAIYLLLTYALDELGYRRMEWKCNALNDPSRRAARRFGFTYEGTFYRHLIVKGRNRDTAWYSILSEEWPEIRAAYQTWLAPDNFDEGGVQRLSLSALTAR